jgi:hypothetical protein
LVGFVGAVRVGGHKNSFKLFFSKNEQKEKNYPLCTKGLRVVILSMGEGTKTFLHSSFQKLVQEKNLSIFMFM